MKNVFAGAAFGRALLPGAAIRSYRTCMVSACLCDSSSARREENEEDMKQLRNGKEMDTDSSKGEARNRIAIVSLCVCRSVLWTLGL